MKTMYRSAVLACVMAAPVHADPFWGAIGGGIEGSIIGGIIGGEEGAVDGAWIGGTAGAIDGAVREQERRRIMNRDLYYDRRQPAAPRRQVQSSGSLVVDVQLELRRLGYNPGPADGVAGQGTARALAAYKTDHGLPNDGVINQALLQHMRAR